MAVTDKAHALFPATALALGCREEETADVTQEFFASFLRNGGFERANPDLSKLRTFIKHAAGNFLTNHWRNQSTQRRGGGVNAENIDEVRYLIGVIAHPQ